MTAAKKPTGSTAKSAAAKSKEIADEARARDEAQAGAPVADMSDLADHPEPAPVDATSKAAPMSGAEVVAVVVHALEGPHRGDIERFLRETVAEVVPIEDDTRTIHQRMVVASRAIVAVAKDLHNERSGYAARSIDGVLDAIHAPLADAGIYLRPEMVTRTAREHVTAGGSKQELVEIRMAYHFVGACGDEVTVEIEAEALDSSDKATNKAMSAALKMGLIQAFTIPVNGPDADADHDTPERGTADPGIQWATPRQVTDLAARVATYMAAVGRNAHPPEWIAAELWPIRRMVAEGAYASVVEQANGIMDRAEAELATKAADAAQNGDESGAAAPTPAEEGGGAPEGGETAPGPESGTGAVSAPSAPGTIRKLIVEKLTELDGEIAGADLPAELSVDVDALPADGDAVDSIPDADLPETLRQVLGTLAKVRERPMT